VSQREGGQQPQQLAKAVGRLCLCACRHKAVAACNGRINEGAAATLLLSCFTHSSQVVTVEDYDLYCHYVAGLVGIGLSQLFGEFV
jgi:hypothetical protein